MPGCSGLDRVFPEWEQPLFPPLPLAWSSGSVHAWCMARAFLGRRSEASYPYRFPEVLFLSLVNDGEYTGDGFKNENLGEFGSLTVCHFSHTQLG